MAKRVAWEDRNVSSGGRGEKTDQELDADLRLVREDSPAEPIQTITEPVITSGTVSDRELDEDLRAQQTANRETQRVQDVRLTGEIIADTVCSCCRKPWRRLDNRMAGPGCGCALHPTCRTCGQCAAHCACRRVIVRSESKENTGGENL